MVHHLHHPCPAQDFSILNRRPSLVQGPKLLHELVCVSSDFAALDFLEHGSTRREISYETLHILSSRLAGKIASALEKLENASTIIPVLLPQSPELYITLLAVLKAGKAFCPLNLDTPQERLNFILNDISATMLITDSLHLNLIPQGTKVQVLVADHELTTDRNHASPANASIDTTDLAYVLYTSGSTGQPKAVSISHRAVTQSLLAHDRHIPEFTRFLQFAAPTFDVSIFEIFFPWYRGRTLVGCTRTHMINDLPGAIQTLRADAAELTPTVVSNLLQGRKSVPGLKLLLTIGEMLSQHVIDEFGGSESQKSILWGMYGPTEAAIHCTLQPSFASNAPVGTIGFPLDTASAFVIAPPSDSLPPTTITVLPLGEVGELAIGGPQVADGYRNRPELTAASFIDDAEYGLLYRTGDKARLRSDGMLECLGRIVSGQVKIRGQRVELGEIEQTLTTVDGCHTAAAMVVGDNIIAFCAIGSYEVTKSHVLNICKHWLPGHMVPADVYFVPTMPQLPSGKIDKKALEAQYLHVLQCSDLTAIEPDDQVGLSILSIIERHLDHALALGSNLAFAGLDSLKAIRIASSLREEGYNLGAMDVLAAQTLEELTSACRQSPNLDMVETSPNLDFETLYQAIAPELAHRQAEIADIIPCTPLQEAMLTETMMRPRAYCNWLEVELSLARTFDELSGLLRGLIQSNEVLRSGFCSISNASGTFAQIVWKEILSSQIREVSEFSRAFSLGSAESLWHPLAIQVKPGPGKPHLLFQIHHALYDGWSFDLLLNDLDRLLHGAEVAQRPQFREVVKYVVQEQTEISREDDKAYWTNLLQGYTPSPLPNFNGRIVDSGALGSITGRYSVDVSLLNQCSRELSVNPQVFFQTATAYILALYTGSTDVTIGTVTSGRTMPLTGIEEVMGPCIATLPFRLDFASLPTIQDTLAHTQGLNRDMLHHCILPLRDIVKSANVRPGTKLFDVLFVWQQSLSSASSSLAARTVASADDLEFSVTLEFEPRDDCIQYRITYDPAIIPEIQVNCLSRQIEELVQLFLLDPQGRMSNISTAHSTQTLSIANPSPVQIPFNHGPAYAVEKWASQSPHSDAINIGHIDGGVMTVKERMTYGELNCRANQLARALIEHGVTKDELICVLMDKSVELYVAILAVLKIGSGYLPIVPDTPVERIKTIMMDAEISLCLSDSSVCQSLEEQLLTTIVDVDQVELSKYSDQDLNVPYDGSHLAYAVWTSGSTGIPKGVLVTQDNLMSNLEYLAGVYPTSVDSRMLQACSQAFDVSVFEIFFSWHVGMCLCTALKDDLFYDLETAIDRLGITHLSLTPTVAALVNPTKVPKVKFLVTAGEGVTEHVRRQWTGRGLFQGYGPSETTNICTVRASMSPDDLINNIGPPFDNTSAFVMDPLSNAILPRGAVGELCFGGQQVFRGYLNRAELNAKKIIDHPLYGRVYRSGDTGILLPDNSILFTGRSDDQVKIRGQRVELGEITSIVLDNDGVKDCTTLLLHGEGGNQRLVNFWVPIQVLAEGFKTLCPVDFRFTIHGIFESLSLQVPSYMIPSHLMPITEIPMTSQGKIDKRLLIDTFIGLTEGCLECSASSFDVSGGRRGSRRESMSSLEKDVARVLAQTLNVPLEEIRRNSSFFHLGLDSVSAIRFSSGLRASGMGTLPVSAILKNSTIASLCSSQKISRSSSHRNSDNQLLSLAQVFQDDQLMQILFMFRNEGVAVTKMLPCTPLQEAMLSTMDSRSDSAYCNTMIFEINGELSSLQDCWTIMVQRHEILRTTFVAIEDPQYAFAQVVLEYEELGWDEVKVDENLQARVQKILFQRLKSHKPPVWLAIDDTGALPKILFSCHHALYDGTAISTLLTEIQQIYHGSELLPPVPYERYLRHMVRQDLKAADQFWSSSFTDFEPTFFPSLTGQANGKESRASFLTRNLNTRLSDTLKACKDMSVSLLPVIQAVWAKILHTYLGESDICFGNVVSGRILPESGLGRLVAPCFNTLPVRVKYDFKNTNVDLVKKLHDFNIEIMPYQLTPLRRIQNTSLMEGGALFDSLIILQQPSEPLDDSIWSLEEDIGAMDLPIVCEIMQDQVNDVLKLVLHFQTSIMSGEDATLVMETFDSYLQSIIRHPQYPARDVVGFPDHLIAQSNLEFSRLAPADGELLHSGFESNAVLLSEAVALDFQHAGGARTTLTFEALNERANVVAHTLIEKGVQCEDIIPVYISKSPQFYISLLGILKAGAAFTPIHPDLPEARKQFMLTELNPKAILCTTKSFPSGWCGDVTVIDVDKLVTSSKGNPTISGLRPTNLAYCLYTSGSTGVPKAVSMEHRSPLQTIESSRSLIPWDYESRLLQYAATTFDMCYYDCFLAWSFGFTLCAAEQETMLNDLPGVINVLQADLLDLTPSVAVNLSRSEVPGVKWLYCIGEAMFPEVIRDWEGACVNSYGPTETAFCTTMFSVRKETKPSVIGAPFPTTSFAVFPINGERPLPILGIGELYIGGAQLARGYLGKPALTEERFVYKSGQRFYKSGDFVRMLSDGNLEFLGRADDQVKIRGLRVELGEINHVLQSCDLSIASASTQIFKKGVDSKEQLVAFVSTRSSINEYERVNLRAKLEQAAATHLPLYMAPQFFLFLDKIPKSMAGKVDKNALAKIFRESDEAQSTSNGFGENDPDHEWTEIELCIRRILARLSKTPEVQISPRISIYQLGLDSISAVQIATALRKQGFTVDAADIMRNMNCADIAAFLGRSIALNMPREDCFDFVMFHQTQIARVIKTCGLKHSDIEAIRPCTPLQQGMLSQFIAKNGAIYFNYLHLRMNDGVDLGRMKEAWNEVMKKHIMLRTGFVHINGNVKSFGMVQYTKAAAELPWYPASSNTPARSIDDWLQSLQRNAVRNLHQSPWAIRVIEHDEKAYLDLALFHGLFDAQSLAIIFNDVAAIYNNNQTEQPIEIEPLIGKILQLGNDKENEDFWIQLGKKAAPTRVPNMAPLRYSPLPPRVLTKTASRSLRELEAGCQNENITLQAAGVASWLSILAAYTGEQSVTCGVVLSGRNFEAAEGTVFPCITTVPFSCVIADNKEEVLRDIMKLNAEVQHRQFTPLNTIQRLMGYSTEPLFDSIFAFQKLSSAGSQNSLWEVVKEKATIEYPVSIELEPKGGQLEYRLTFLPHVIPKRQGLLILEQLDHFMSSFVFPRAHLNTASPIIYSITPAKESTLWSEVKLLHEMVELTVSKYPDRAAFEFATSVRNGKYTSKVWTYAEMDAEGNRIAHLLIGHGVQPGELVGVCFDKCPEASFAMLGILKAGCAFVAIDPGAPSTRQAFIVRDSRATAVLSMQAQSAGFRNSIDVPLFNLDEADLSLVPTNKPSLKRSISPQDRSYCLYTSGTTGTPKGCELTHENAVQALQAFQRLFAGHYDDRSRWLQFASFHFDVSVLEQYWSWAMGICVVSAPRDLIFEDLAGSISTLDITHIDLTPSLARLLHPDDVPSLCRGVFITGGESLKQEILDAWGPRSVIYNGYGPTEATIGVTMYPRVPENGKPSNIGPQFENVGSYVLKLGTNIPVLRGGIGELCVAGKLVGKGYLNRPDLTNERFPYLKRFNERVYRTGDLVRILYDGSFDFIGRADDQVKLRGQRLEIGEINSVIKQATSGICDLTTLVLRHPKQQKEQLVSFVVVESTSKSEPQIILERSSDIEKARDACQEKLPGYMIPTHFVALTSMPLNVNNKADGRKLREMYEALSTNELQALSASAQPGDDEWSTQESKLRDMISQVLDLNREVIGKDSSLFELGMDSISVIWMSKSMKQAGFAFATVSEIMKNASIRRLAKVLSNKNSSSKDRGSIIAAQQAITAAQHRYRRAAAEALFVDAREIQSLAPCTPLQQGMIAKSLENNQGLYFNSFLFDLYDGVDIARLRGAWEEVYASAQILRTAFANTEDGYVQAVLRRSPLAWKDFQVPDGFPVSECLGKLRKEWLGANVKALRRPLEVIVLVTPEKKLLCVHIFHALYDGNSIAMVFKAVWDAYNGIAPGKEEHPFQSVLPYGPLRQIEGAREFWQNQISSAFRPFPSLVDTQDQAASFVSRELSNLSNFDTIRRKLNVTAQAIVQACWASILQKHVRGSVTLGMVVSGRSFDLEGAEEVNGPLFNTIPHQYRPRRDENWASLIKRTHEFNVTAHSYQHTPLRDIMKWCKRGPFQPLFDTLFVYQVTEGHEQWMKNDAWELRDALAEADYPLAIEVEQKGTSTLTLTVVIQEHLSNPKTSEGLIDEFEASLRQALDDPESVLEVVLDVTEDDADETAFPEAQSTSPSSRTVANFRWTDNAIKIREEVANLAGLDIRDITETSSLFDLGLDSIDAIKLSSKLKKRGIDLPVSAIMKSPVIADIVENIASSRTQWAHRPSNMIFKSYKQRLESYLERRNILSEEIVRALPLTPLQEAMVAEMVDSDYKRYYNHDVLKLAPNTDLEKLREAWTTVLEISPILRTSFVEIDDPNIDSSFAQIIHRCPHAFWKRIKVESEPNFNAIFDNIRRDATIRASMLAPPFHVHIIEAPRHIYLILSISHALYDGWSLSLLHNDVHRAYQGRLEPRPSYESTLSEILTASGSDAAVFWRDYLAGAKMSSFPVRPSPMIGRQAVYRKEQSSSIDLAEVTSFARKMNITLQTLGQTVYASVLASFAHSLDVGFGSVLSGRDEDGRAGLLFPTMNTVAIRAIIHGSRRGMLQYIQENFANLKQWQHFPLRKALSLVGLQGSSFGSLFIYQKHVNEDDKGSKKLYESVAGQSDVEYPVCVEMEVIDGRLLWRCAVKEEVFDEEGAYELLGKLDDVLRNIIDEPDAPALEFTAAGTSVCGLPAFQDNDYQSSDEEEQTFETSEQYWSNSATAKAIREVLALVSWTTEEDITQDMTIFHLGLDSISAIKVSSLLRKREILLSVGEMLKAGTVAKMAQIVDERNPPSDEDEDKVDTMNTKALENIDQASALRQAGLDPRDVEQVLPATAGQIYFLSMWIHSSGNTFYPEFSYKIPGAVDFQILEDSWQKLVSANPILRTCIVATGDNRIPYVQAVLQNPGPSIINTTGLSNEEAGLLKEEYTSKQPWAYLSVSRSESGWDVKLKIHHILYDGVSLPLFMRQLQDICNGIVSAPANNVFNKYVAHGSTTAAFERRRSFWRNYLKGVKQHYLSQPLAPPKFKVEIFRPCVLPIAEMDAFSRKLGITTQSLFLAVYAKLYASMTITPDDDDVIIGVYLANRSLPIPDLAHTAAPCVNLLPLRVSKPGETELLDIATQIQYDIQEISSPENSSASLFEIAEWATVWVDTFVNFLKLPTAEEEGEGGEAAGAECEGDAAPAVKIDIAGRWEQDVSHVVDIPRTNNSGVPKELTHERVNNACLQTIDIEATVRNGALDIGVFGPAQMLNRKDGEELLENMKTVLEFSSGVRSGRR